MILLGIGIGLLTLCSPVSALQPLEGRDGETLYGKASMKEMTRITMQNGRVTQLVARKGTLIKKKDDERGEFYVQPDPSYPGPLNFYVTDDQNRTFTLLLEQSDIPAETVSIKGRSPSRSTVAATGKKSPAFVRRIKNTWLALASDDDPAGCESRAVNTEMPLWHESKMTLTRLLICSDNTGERYTLTNVSGKPMVVAEQELYRPGVWGIAVESLQLAPNEYTYVYIVRERKENE